MSVEESESVRMRCDGTPISPEMTFEAGGIDLLDAIEPLWRKLNEEHAALSPHFATQFHRRTFAERKRDLLESGFAEMRVELARPAREDVTIGYCIATITPHRMGEIDSIYVERDYRGQRIGERLMRNALCWLEERDARDIALSVAYGNERVWKFYEKFGFYPRATTLMRLRSETER